MKKILSVIIIASLSALINTTEARAQTIALNSASKNTAAIATSYSGVTGVEKQTSTDFIKKTSKATREEKKAARAQRQFSRLEKTFNENFTDASDVKWGVYGDMYVGSFKKDGDRNRVWYTKGGRLVYAMCSYDAQKLPQSEQQLVKWRFPGYSMSIVDEIRQDDILVYVVHLENEKFIKLITICDGQTAVYKNFRKAK